VVANAAAADASDTLSSTVTVVVAGAVICSLGVTDQADALASSCAVSQPEAPEQVHNGRDWKKFDVPTRRVIADLAVVDGDDSLAAMAQVQVRQLMNRLVGLSAIDAGDALSSSASIRWTEPTLLKKPQVKLASSRHEAAMQ